jgi:hypothetical protein
MGNVGVGLVAIVILIILAIAQLWPIILLLTVVGIVIYLYYKHDEKKSKKEQEKLRQEREINRIKRENVERKRLEQEKRERKEEKIREEKLRQEQEENRVKEEKRLRVEKRLEQFHLNKKEAELIFGKTWQKRFEKPDELFTAEIRRIGIKLTESDSYIAKVSPIMEKVFDMTDIFINEIWSKIGDWNDIDFENWEDSWDNVRGIWNETKDHYRSDRKEKYEKNNFNDEQKYYDVLELKVGSTIKEIKAQYRKLMLKFHPDKNKSPDTERKCEEIIEAYKKLMEIATC